MIGRSPEMQGVFTRIRRVASSGASTLVVGETGTGKELVGRALHLAGPRRERPFVAVNCAALPRELIESELFGYKRGAFSGAVGESPGLFRAAAGGTLLLDEITEMSQELQAKLLRILQERTVRPVGAMTEEAVDVRIIASTNRDPDEALRRGVLRADLYYRLAVGTIVVPPLRERRVDIPPLVEYHLAALNARHADERVQGITEAALEALIDEPWLGNVRQLFNVIENAATMCTGMIDVDDLELPSESRAFSGAPTSEAVPTFQESERTLIERTLSFTGGNKVRAAQLLGISRKKLYARLARYGRLS
jgi:transcriptional regulator with PAS, ATPase and Fis domain